MRETTVKGLDDGFEYSFGSDVGIICAAMNTARRVGYVEEESDAITHVCIIDGRTLIDFVRAHARGHEKIIEKINEAGRYKLIAWDW